MRLLVRADARPSIGSGHIMRCLALSQAWQARGGSLTFLAACEGDGLRRRIEAAGAEFIPVTQVHPAPLDLETTLKESALADWTVLDGYHFDTEYQHALRAAGRGLLVIDDVGHLPGYHADVLLNQNVDAEQLRYVTDADTTRLLGMRYAMLRREFLQWRDVPRATPETARKVLVTMGGGDPDNVTSKVIAALFEIGLDACDAKIVVGGNNQHYDDLVRQVERGRRAGKPLEIQLVRDAWNMPELMAWADVAVTAGGSTCWETSFMRLPAVVITVADNQFGIAAGLDRRGVVRNLGWHGSVESLQVARALEDLMTDYAVRREMSERGLQLVDGAGADRIIEALLAKQVSWRA